MAQIRENYSRSADQVHILPAASVDIKAGDVVVMARKGDPISVALLGTAGRIRPIAAAQNGRWAVGVCDTDFTSAAVGADEYATPTAKLPVYRKGVFRLAISQTAGKAGDWVRYSSGAAGAQVFKIDNQRPGWAVGRIVTDFTGASANDLQEVELQETPLGGPNLLHFLENRVIDGCWVKAGPGTLSNVAVGDLQGTVSTPNKVVINNRAYNIARDPTLAFGGNATVGGQSAIRFKWVVARSGSFAIRSASGVFSAFASFTNSGVSAGMMVPVTMTAAEIPIALLCQFSAGAQTAGRIFNIRGSGLIPRVGAWGI